MAIEINGEPISMKDFYPEIEIPKGVESVVFRRFGFEPFRKIISSLDRGDNQPPMHTAHAVVKKTATSGVLVPLVFEAKTDLFGEDASTQEVRFFKSKATSGRGAMATVAYEGGEFWIKGAGTTLKINNPEGQQIYKCLMAHPWNATNAKRYGIREPMFELIEVEKERKLANDNTRYKTRIIALAFNEKEVPDELAIDLHREISPLIGGTQTDTLVQAENWETLRGDLSIYASTYPDKFEKLVKDANVGTRGMIKDAEKLGLIKHDKSRWYWANIKAVKNKKDFCVIAVGQDAVQELLNHFITKGGKKDFELLEKEIDATK